MTLIILIMSPDPEEYLRSLEQPWNCEAPGRGRIRLDNEPPETA